MSTSGVDAWWNESAEPAARYPPIRTTLFYARAVRRGGMGLVYFCDSVAGPDPRVAIKRVAFDGPDQHDSRLRFEQECLLWISLGTHPNIVRAHTVFGLPYDSSLLVLEFVRDSLADILEQRTYSTNEAVALWRDLVAALVYADECLDGFVHADIKPSNVLVGTDGSAKLTDLGLSRAGASIRERPERGGTPKYMPPEQMRDGASGASDVYSVALVVAESLSVTFGSDRGRRAIRQSLDVAGCHGLTPAQRTLLLRSLDPMASRRPSLAELSQLLNVPAHQSLLLTRDRSVLTETISGIYNSAAGLMALARYDAALEVNLSAPSESLNRRQCFNFCLQRCTIYRLKEDLESAAHEVVEAERLLLPKFGRQARALLLAERSAVLVVEDRPIAAMVGFLWSLALAPTSAAWVEVARIYRRQGNSSAALAAYEAAVTISSNFNIYRDVIELLWDEGNVELALQWADRMVIELPEHSGARFIRVVAAIQYLVRVDGSNRRIVWGLVVADYELARRGIASEQLAVMDQAMSLARDCFPDLEA